MEEELITCKDCGLTYMMPYDRREHNAHHKEWERACEIYGCYLRPYRQREDEKCRLWPMTSKLEEMLDKSEGKEKERILSELATVYDELFQFYYERSVLGWVARYGLKTRHCSFNSYVALLLGQKHWKDDIIKRDEVYKRLVSIYGCIPGMKNGSSYFEASEKCLLRKAA